MVSGYFSTPSIREDEIRQFHALLEDGVPALVVGDFNESNGGRAVTFLRQRGYKSALPEFDTPQDTWRWTTSVGEISTQLDHIVYGSPVRSLANWSNVRAQGYGDRMNWCVAVVAGTLVAAPNVAHASESAPQFGGVLRAAAQAIANLYFYSQVQIGSAAVVADAQRPGGMSVRGSLSVVGLGAQGWFRYEQDLLAPTQSVRRGALGGAAFEFRPVPFAQSRWHRFVDPHVAAGFELGGGAGAFRATSSIAAGLDIGLMPWLDEHPALTLQYQWRPLQTPDDYATHLLQFGMAWRIVG